MATYKSSYTGPQIDQAVSHAVNMDVNPTVGHNDRVVSSGGVKSALDAMNTLSTDTATITNPAFTGSGITLNKIGHFVSFKVLIQSDNPTATLYAVGTVPVGFRPITGQQIDINQENAGGAKSFCVIRFDDNGNIYLIPSANSGTTYYRGSGNYIV